MTAPLKITLETAKRIYIAAGGNKDHSDTEWTQIHPEMDAVVNARTDRAAAKVIDWWSCWDARYTASAFARRVRKAHQAQP